MTRRTASALNAFLHGVCSDNFESGDQHALQDTSSGLLSTDFNTLRKSRRLAVNLQFFPTRARLIFHISVVIF